MATSTPTVMVSSTFYDLKQIRADLKDFINNEMGFIPLLSELDSFPIDPKIDTIENCRRRVEENADILVLIIGGRCGHIDSSTSKSVTNLEYLTAQAKGIPIFVFVQRNVLNILPVWQDNPTANFNRIVDNTQVLHFISEIRDTHKMWVQEFDIAQQIITALRSRFANLTYEGLSWLQRTHTYRNQPAILKTLRGRALRIALERPFAWELKLFFQLICNELSERKVSRHEQRLGFVLGIIKKIPLEETGAWFLERTAELRAIVSTLRLLFDELNNNFSDPEKILFLAQSIGKIYGEAIEWVQRVRKFEVDEIWKDAHRQMPSFADGIIENIDLWATRCSKSVDSLIGPTIDKPIDLHLHIELGGDFDSFMRNLSDIERAYLTRK